MNDIINSWWLAPVLGLILDAIWGDPRYRLHLVRLIGDGYIWGEALLRKLKLDGYFGGICLLLMQICVFTGLWYGGQQIMRLSGLSAWIWLWDSYWFWHLFCNRDLLKHGYDIAKNLWNLPRARILIARLVGRDTAPMNRQAVVRATIESLSENLVDGIITPLFAAALGGLPGLIIYKVISTGDSMVGYKNERYLKMGWASARADDCCNWLTARLSVLILWIIALWYRARDQRMWHAARTHHQMLPGPNSGWSEAAIAGLFPARLAGPIYQDGVLVNEQWLGDSDWPEAGRAHHLRLALRVIRGSVVLSLLIAGGLAVLIQLLIEFLGHFFSQFAVGFTF